MYTSSITSIKKLLTVVCLVALLSYNSYALTEEEAEVMYNDLNCTATIQEGACTKIACPVIEEMTKFYVVEWDDPPIPEPEPEPDPDVCVATWCGLPVQDCFLPPLTNGMDSCGKACSKPSPEWPHCLLNGVMVDYN